MTLSKDEALNLFEAARLERSTIYDREKLAAHWLERLDFFSRHLCCTPEVG
jgi:hypothetical protein